MIYGERLFSLIQCNTQDVGKLNRYFNQVMGDFGPHESVQLFKFLSPSPPFNPASSGESYHHL